MLLRILIVANNPQIQKKLHGILSQTEAVLETFNDYKQFWRKVSKITCDIIIADKDLFSPSDAKKIFKLRNLPDNPLIIVITEEENPELRAYFIAAGCEAVLNTKLSTKKIGPVLTAIFEKRRKAAIEVLDIRRKIGEPTLDDFISKSSSMTKFMRVVRRVIKGSSPVLILGETGVGKERLAQAIHTESPRAQGPFVAVNCAALPENLLESELFGHEEGAFTGATRSRRGCFELAHLGTIFLDEIAELPLHLQVKLLRAVEQREICRVGSEKSIPVDVRVMAATNRDIDDEVRTKQFRKDLYYRLNVVQLTIPPLRERVDDIPHLAQSYIDYLGPRIGCEILGMSDDALEMLCQYSWPGNVRELINVIERAMLLCEGEIITTDDLPDTVTGKYAIPLEPVPSDENPQEISNIPDDWLKKPLWQARQVLIEQFEFRYLASLLRSTNGRVGATAKRAGIDERTLFEKMKKYGLQKKDFREK